MIKAITFDYWDTLYRGAGARDLRMKRLTDVLRTNDYTFDQAVLDEADRAAWTEWTRVWHDEHRTLGAGDWLRLMLGRLGASLPAPTFDALAVEWDEIILHGDTSPQLVDGAASVLRRLAQRYRLGIISDTGLSSGRTLRRLLERDAIDACFTCLSFSDETGVSKPHPNAFRLTLECLGAQPAETIHIGDLTRTDIAGAKAVGMRGVRFSGSHDDPDRSVIPDAAVGTFADFELLVRAWDEKS